MEATEENNNNGGLEETDRWSREPGAEKGLRTFQLVSSPTVPTPTESSQLDDPPVPILDIEDDKLSEKSSEKSENLENVEFPAPPSQQEQELFLNGIPPYSLALSKENLWLIILYKDREFLIFLIYNISNTKHSTQPVL